MIVTENEARKLNCVYWMRASWEVSHSRLSCVGSGCMAWKWVEQYVKHGKELPPEEWTGCCGIIYPNE